MAMAASMPGTGLGLALARSLVERMGGEIRLDTEYREGARFVVDLPLLEAAEAPATAAPPALDRPGEGLRVLVAEDNSVNQFVARSMLQRLGCEVEIAGDGEAALANLEHRNFDLVLMDCRMPVLDGWEATRRWRELEHGRPRTPVIALTACAMEHEKERCISAGMDDHLPKPLELEALAKCLQKWGATARGVSPQGFGPIA